MKPGDLRVSNPGRRVVCRVKQNLFYKGIPIEGAIILLEHFAEAGNFNLQWKVLTNMGVMFTSPDMLEATSSEQ